MKHERATGLIGANARRIFEAGEFFLFFATGRAGIDLDVRAGHERLEPVRDSCETAGAEARTNDPKSRVIGEHAARFAIELHLDDHVRQIFGERYVAHRSEIHVLVMNLCLSGDEPRCGFEGERDGRTFGRERMHAQINDERCGDNRNEPEW